MIAGRARAYHPTVLVPWLSLVAIAAGAAVSSTGTKPKRVLFVVSAAPRIRMADDKTMECGYWTPELAIPSKALQEAGFAIDVATPGGQIPVADPNSLGGTSPESLVKQIPQLEKPLALEKIEPARLADYAAVVIPGGYSPMVDLTDSRELGRLLREAMKRNMIVAAICHGPAAFLSAREGDDWPFRGKTMTSFTDGEEEAWLRGKKLPWTVEAALKKEGVRWVGAPIWASHVERDGNLITAQSSHSTDEFTKALLEALR